MIDFSIFHPKKGSLCAICEKCHTSCAIAKENANMFDEKGNASMLPDEKHILWVTILKPLYYIWQLSGHIYKLTTLVV